MRRLTRFGLVALLLAVVAGPGTAPPTAVHAEPLPEETIELLEKSLSIAELDREIGRIGQLRETAGRSLADSRERLAEQEIAIAVHRERAGRVLRSYYKGERDLVLSALLSANSLNDLLRAWEWIDYIVSSDRRSLDRYAADYRALQQGYEQLKLEERELAQVENALVEQRGRIERLQREVEQALAGRDDADNLRRLMEEMNAYWSSVGLFEVRRNFRALAEAMKQLPSWLDEHPEALEQKGLKAKLTITDAQLNAFIREQDSRLTDLTVFFLPGIMSLQGDNGDVSIRIDGRYTIVNEPENAIRFGIEKLVFNGFELPDTTRADLEREFDLGFYPRKLVKFVKAERVTLEEGRLVVELGIG